MRTLSCNGHDGSDHPPAGVGVVRAQGRGLLTIQRQLYFTWRSFRRSTESAMHKSGASLKAQQAVLGHSNPNMTLVYAEADEAAKRQAVEELGRLIFPKLSQFATAIAIGSVN